MLVLLTRNRANSFVTSVYIEAFFCPDSDLYILIPRIASTAKIDMALRPASIAQSPYLHPVGNTPAVCLTDSLASEIDAKVLLLGCGDVRNILFTVYIGRSSGRL